MPLPAGQPVLILIGASEDSAKTAQEMHRCKMLHPTGRGVVLDDHCNREAMRAAIQAGASAYLMKTITTEALLKALDLVMLGETVFSSSFLPLVHDLVEDSQPAAHPVPGYDSAEEEIKDPVARRLSSREIDTLRCLVEGCSNKIIARRFSIAEATVKVHVKAILRKIRVGNRTQAAIWAMSNLPPAVSPVEKEEACLVAA